MSGILMLGLPIIMLSSCKKAPTADFTHTATELEVAFTFTGEGDVDAYSWSFGDGETSTEENPTHTYAAGGNYSVSLTVTNTNGNDTWMHGPARIQDWDASRQNVATYTIMPGSMITAAYDARRKWPSALLQELAALG